MTIAEITIEGTVSDPTRYRLEFDGPIESTSKVETTDGAILSDPSVYEGQVSVDGAVDIISGPLPVTVKNVTSGTWWGDPPGFIVESRWSGRDFLDAGQSMTIGDPDSDGSGGGSTEPEPTAEVTGFNSIPSDGGNIEIQADISVTNGPIDTEIEYTVSKLVDGVSFLNESGVTDVVTLNDGDTVSFTTNQTYSGGQDVEVCVFI